MILYRPDGFPQDSALIYKPRHVFLITRLGKPLADEPKKMRDAVTRACRKKKYKVIDATVKVTGRDFLFKIWNLIATTPVSVGICHESFSKATLMNIYYELGMARTMGKETVIVKSAKAKHPSDLVRDEYIEFNGDFAGRFSNYLDELDTVAESYETMADALDLNPLLAIDFLRRAYLITADKGLKTKINRLAKEAKFGERAKNSVEMLMSKI
jgi:hypothetical protein